MIHISFEILSALLDTFVLVFFLKSMLGKRKTSIWIYILVIILCEAIVTTNSMIWGDIHNIQKQICTIAISLLTTYICICLYVVPIRYRISFTILFQLITALSEPAAYGLLGIVDAVEVIDTEYLYIYVITVSKFIIFIITLLIRNIFSFSEEYRHSKYNYFLLITPSLSILITLNLPHVSKASPQEFKSTFICITLLTAINIFNYIMFNYSVKYFSAVSQNKALQKIMEYQSSKYSSLQDSYRGNREIIHEIKNTITTIEGYLDCQEYDRLKYFLKDTYKYLDNYRTYINTGNIVIDTLVSEYISKSKKEGIDIKHTITINTAKIKPNDYDLSIILGNLLDNAYNAVTKISIDKKRFIEINIFTNDTALIINIENPVSSHDSVQSSPSIDHGFGINNIKKTVYKYDGNYTYGVEPNGIYQSVITLPYDLTENDFNVFSDTNVSQK